MTRLLVSGIALLLGLRLGAIEPANPSTGAPARQLLNYLASIYRQKTLTGFATGAIDQDGYLLFSNIVVLNHDFQEGAMRGSVFPVPAKKEISVSLVAEKEEVICITISDMQGAILLKKEFLSSEGENLLTMDLNNLASGTYLLRASRGGDVLFRSRFIKE